MRASTTPPTHRSNRLDFLVLRYPWQRSARRLCLCVAAFAAAHSAWAAPGRCRFDLPPNEAEKSLRQFSVQSGVPLVFPSEIARGVRTPAVRGTFLPREALDRLLAGSGLVAVEDKATGALVIAAHRKAAPVSADRAASPAPQPPKKKVSMTPRTNTTLAALTAVLLASPFAALSTAAEAASPPEDRVVLSPFTVATEKDQGYQAADSLAGGRIATNVLKTPADQTILTREFLDDIAADNYIDAGRWLPNATVSVSGGSDFGQGVTFRGVSPAGYPYRNYFRSLGPVDDYTVDRLDNARGPNSLIFADGVIGGIINTSTKRASFGRPRTELKLRVNSEGSIRGALDIGRRLTDKIAARVNLVAENEKRYNLFEQHRRGAHLAVSFRPWAKSEFRVEAEAQDLEYWGSTTSRFTDQVSSWNGIQTFAGPSTVSPGNGVSRLTASKISYGAAFASTGPLDYLNFGQTAGTGIGLTQTDRTFNVVLPKLDRAFQFLTPNKPSLQRQMALGLYFEKELTDRVAFEVAVHRSRQDRTNEPSGGVGNYYIDVNTLLPNGALNPKFGQAYTETNADHSSGDNRNTDARAAAVYTFPFQSFSQRVNVLAGWREEDFIAVTDRYSRSNGPVADLRNGGNLTILRRYFSDGAEQNLVRPVSGQNGYNFDWVRTQDRHQKQELRNVQLATVGSYFSDRLNVIAGAGYYDYKQYQTDIDIPTLAANGKPTKIAYSAVTLPVSTVRSSVGAVYFPIKQVGFYANRSSSFTPTTSGDPGLDGKQFDPTDGQGYGAGLRGNFMNGRITGSAGYYDSSEKNRITSFSASEINSLWNILLKSEKNIPTSNYRDRLDYTATGYEGEMTANVAKGLRIFANISFPKTAQTNTIVATRAYYAANIAEWQAGAADPAQTPGNRTTLTNNINTLKARLDNAAEGRPLNGTQKYTANIFANYFFQQTSLKGLRIGSGANVIGRRLIGNQLNLPFDYYYGQARYVLTATSAYEFKIRSYPMTLQLNVTNVLNYSDPVFTSSTTNAITNSRATGTGYFYEDPRKFTLSLHIRL